MIDAFCGVVAWGSVQFNNFVAAPGPMLLVLAGIVAIAVFLVRRTSWGLVEAMPLARRRRIGEILRVAGAVCLRHPASFVALGTIALPVAALAVLVSAVVRRLPLVGDLVVVSDSEGTGGRLVISSMLAGIFAVFAFVLVSAAVAWIVGDPQGIRPSLRGAAQAVVRRSGALALTFLPAAVFVVVLAITVVGIPIAVWLVVRWQFLGQVTMLEGIAGRPARARSAALVRTRWWHTAVVTVIVLAIVHVVGIAVGLVLLIAFTGLPLWALTAIVVLCDLLIMPFGALVMTYLYGDALAAC